jgi:hypothetical protein
MCVTRWRIIEPRNSLKVDLDSGDIVFRGNKLSLLGNLVGGGITYEVPSSPSRTDIQNAVAIIGMAAIGADGHFDKNEIVELQNSLVGMRLYNDVSSEVAFNKAAKMFDKNRDKATIWAKEVSKLSGWENTAFVLLCSLVFSDGEIDSGEAKFVDDMQSAMGVDADFTQSVANTFTQLYREN